MQQSARLLAKRKVAPRVRSAWRGLWWDHWFTARQATRAVRSAWGAKVRPAMEAYLAQVQPRDREEWELCLDCFMAGKSQLLLQHGWSPWCSTFGLGCLRAIS